MAKAKLIMKKATKKIADEEDELAGGASLDDAFGDDEDVEYAESKPQKAKKKKDEDLEEELDEELDEIEAETGVSPGVEQGSYAVKSSKPIEKIKKGDKIKIDGKEYQVDSHYVLIDHKTTKEMTIEMFDPKTDKDYQLRYFSDQVDSTLEFYELQEIMYFKRAFSKIEW